MGFLKAIADIATSIGHDYAKQAIEIREIKEKLERKSDEELIKIIKSNGFFAPSRDEKAIALYILKKERGISPD